MNWVTLPDWLWIIYYLFLLSALVAGIVSLIKNKYIILSIISIIFAITLPALGLINSIGRLENTNEFQHLFIQLQEGSIWAIYSVIGYLYLFLWFILFLVRLKKKY